MCQLLYKVSGQLNEIWFGMETWSGESPVNHFQSVFKGKNPYQGISFKKKKRKKEK